MREIAGSSDFDYFISEVRRNFYGEVVKLKRWRINKKGVLIYPKLKTKEYVLNDIKNGKKPLILLNYTYYDYLIEFISKLDFIISNAIVALKYNYYKPEISGGKSSFIIKDLRHPIAERLVSNEYITNDVTLGLGTNVSFNDYNHNSPYGLLLYGINASGKTTLAKAIGCVIILAQAGCYVPCRSY